jgi:hypothetical protein
MILSRFGQGIEQKPLLRQVLAKLLHFLRARIPRFAMTNRAKPDRLMLEEGIRELCDRKD